MRHIEDNLQISCIKYFSFQYPKIAHLLHHSPNGGRRNVREGARFKEMGTRAGFPDLVLLVPRGKYHGAFFELKSPKGVLQPSQRKYIQMLEEQGYYVAVIRSIKDFVKETELYLELKHL